MRGIGPEIALFTCGPLCLLFAGVMAGEGLHRMIKLRAGVCKSQANALKCVDGRTKVQNHVHVRTRAMQNSAGPPAEDVYDSQSLIQFLSALF